MSYPSATTPNASRRRAVWLLTALLVTLLASGCSSVQIAYRGADFFIERYADDTLGLNSGQLADWSPTLDAALAKHRQEELPHLAGFFDAALKAEQAGFDPKNLACLTDAFKGIYQRHMTIAAEAAAPLLADLNRQQVNDLEKQFRKEAKDDKVDPTAKGKERRYRKRAERWNDNLDWWMGPLSSVQKRIVAEETRKIPDSAGAWYSYRDKKRRELIKLLRKNAGVARVKRFMSDWLVDYKDLPNALARARQPTFDGVSGMLIRVDKTLTSRQRNKLQGRLKRLRNDFKSLQKKPRVEPVRCG